MALKHGTRSKYVLDRCRCPKCRKANADHSRKLYQAKNGKVKR